MYIYWKPLFLLGIGFWITLFSTDVLRRHKIFESFIPVSPSSCSTIEKNLYYERKIEIAEEYQKFNEIEMGSLQKRNEPPPIFETTKKAIVEEKKSSPSVVLETTSSEKLGSDLGSTMILLNIVIFVVSIVFCWIAKFVTSIFFKNFKKSPVVPSQAPMKTAPIETVPIGDTMKDRISLESLKTTSSSNTELKQSSDQICQTIFHTTAHLKHDQELRVECTKLREELLILQSNSIKEHALLSRKLDAMTKEKRDLTKRLSVTLNENNVAKTQIEEIMEEKKVVQKKLDNVSKDARQHMKTKKVALGKLEEISVTVEDLKRQLEQVTRDKEILQGKLQVLRTEYEKMQERMRIMQLKETRRNQERTMKLEIEKAEKDENVLEKSNEEQSMGDSSQSSLNRIQNVYLPYVISQTELDMKNIQKKILQLEQNIKGFGPRTDILQELAKSEKEAEQELETVNKSPDEGEKLVSVLAKIRSTKEDPNSRNSYDEMKLQLLRNVLKEKIKILETLKDKGDDSLRNVCASESSTVTEDDFEMSSEEANSTPRLVSNSQAFQKFLKNIGAETAVVDIGDTKLTTECR